MRIICHNRRSVARWPHRNGFVSGDRAACVPHGRAMGRNYFGKTGVVTPTENGRGVVAATGLENLTTVRRTT
jgi:hypothetical protein